MPSQALHSTRWWWLGRRLVFDNKLQPAIMVPFLSLFLDNFHSPPPCTASVISFRSWWKKEHLLTNTKPSSLLKLVLLVGPTTGEQGP